MVCKIPPLLAELLVSDICGSRPAVITDKWEGLGLLLTAITPNIQPNRHTRYHRLIQDEIIRLHNGNL